jgi:hypothetical protein
LERCAHGRHRAASVEALADRAGSRHHLVVVLVGGPSRAQDPKLGDELVVRAFLQLVDQDPLALVTAFVASLLLGAFSALLFFN